jgi:L-threonylcarbamoyladenylate synthase
LALEILAAFEGLAAPSANRFGKTSPTTAAHVRAEFEQVLVVDGGPCEVGIESTLVHIANEHRLIIYRPGYYTAQMLEQILKRADFEVQVTYQESPVAPGHLKHHYMPDIPVLVGHKKSTAEVLKAAEESLQRKFTNAIEIYLGEDAILAARKFYQELRDKTPGHDAIVIRTSPVHLREEWKGLMNRLEKAASFRC